MTCFALSSRQHFCTSAMALAMLALAQPVLAQVAYSGQLGKQSIQLVLDPEFGERVRAIYAYNRYDTPIRIDGVLAKGQLQLREQDAEGKPQATLRFDAFDIAADLIEGEWQSQDGMTVLPIRLNRQFEIKSGDNVVAVPVELLQAVATDQHYFKLVVAKENDDYSPRVTALKVYQKGRDRLLQTIPLQAELRGFDSLSVGDFNFDGIEDIAVFESSYAGPNTSSIYLLRDPKTGSFSNSGFTGTSLDFDAERKLIHEHNQCCAGRSHMSATYKVVDNQMVLVEKSCLEYSEKEDDLVAVTCQDEG